MVFAAVKKDDAGKRRPKQNRAKKHSEERKGKKTQNLADERRITGRFAKRFSGERPVSLGFELTFLSEFKWVVWRVLDRAAKRRACICQAPAKVPFEVYNGFLLEFNSKIVYNRKNNIAVIVRAFYEKKTYFDYMFISFILPDDFFGV